MACCQTHGNEVSRQSNGDTKAVSESLNSQVSVVFKRGVVNDDPVDMKNWQNGSTNEDESIHNIQPSDDSNFNRFTTNEVTDSYAFESEDRIKYESSLSRRELELDEIINKYPSGSVDQMKAILNHIYLKKSKQHLHKSTRKRSIFWPSETTTSGHASTNPRFIVTDLRTWRALPQNQTRIDTIPQASIGVTQERSNYSNSS
ncbi:unnamed protein product, partial [Iphiclides podalirius]